MKKTGILSLAMLLVVFTAAASAQTVEQVVNNYTAAVSGGKSFEDINSMKMVMTGKMGTMGDSQFSGMMEGQEMKYTMYTLKPDKFRMEMKVGPMNMVMGNDGSSSWMSMMGRTMDMPNQNDSGFENMMEVYNGNIVAAYDESAYAGTGSFAGEQCHILDVKNEGQASKLYFSAGTGLFVGMTSKMDQGEMQMTVSDYRDVSGYKIPHKYSMSMNGDKVIDMIIQEMVINPPVDESMFNRPG